MLPFAALTILVDPAGWIPSSERTGKNGNRRPTSLHFYAQYFLYLAELRWFYGICSILCYRYPFLWRENSLDSKVHALQPFEKMTRARSRDFSKKKDGNYSHMCLSTRICCSSSTVFAHRVLDYRYNVSCMMQALYHSLLRDFPMKRCGSALQVFFCSHFEAECWWRYAFADHAHWYRSPVVASAIVCTCVTAREHWIVSKYFINDKWCSETVWD